MEKERAQRHRRWMFVPLVLICVVLVGLLRPTNPHETPELVRQDHSPDLPHFQLKHMFHHGAGNKNYKKHKRLDVTAEWIQKQKSFASTSKNQETDDWPEAHSGQSPWDIRLPIKTSAKTANVARLADRHEPGFIESYLDHARSVKGNPRILNRIHLEWEFGDIVIPDMEDRDTLVSLATITLNAYVRYPQSDKERLESDWRDVDGVVPDQSHDDIEFGWLGVGLRGHVFVSEDNSTVIIGIKGTSGAGLPGGGSDETAPEDKTNDNLLFLCCCARVGYMWTTVCDCYEKTYTCNQDCLERELMRKDRYYQAVLDIYKNVTAIYDPRKYNIWVTGHSLGGALALLLGHTYGVPAVAFEAPGEALAARRLHLPQPPGIPRYLEHIWHVGHTADPIYMGVCNGASSSCNVAGYAMETACHTGLQCVYDVVAEKGWRVSLLNHRIHTVIDDVIMQYNNTPVCEEQPPCRDCFNWRYTSHDDDELDEPLMPNPLRPAKSTTGTRYTSQSSSKTKNSNESTATKSSTKEKSASTTRSATKTEPTSLNTATSLAPSKPQKCLERTWYGWCLKWGDDDEEEEKHI